jgi:hypothetical protein
VNLEYDAVLPRFCLPTLRKHKPCLISNLMHKILIYLHIIHLLKSSTCFEHYFAHHKEVYVVIVYMQPLVSSLPAGDCPVHRLGKNSLASWVVTVYSYVDIGWY